MQLEASAKEKETRRHSQEGWVALAMVAERNVRGSMARDWLCAGRRMPDAPAPRPGGRRALPLG